MLSRPPSPVRIYSSYDTPQDPSSPSAPMGKPHNTLDIVLPSSYLCLRGTGTDVQPCWLRGNVVLTLVEPTTIKEITLHFRGKSRVPTYHGENTSVLGGHSQTQTIFAYEWSFLQSELTHSPTLKAGRHVFPFDLQLEDWLPSSTVVPSSLASIWYKLRATAVKSGFSANLHATMPLRILRSFAPEALEYQQTLEIENTWPDKLMYSMMLPHKAWAVGDTVQTLVKFSPLVKGVRISSITLTLQEQIKTYTRAGCHHENSRAIAVAKHEIRDGHAVSVPHIQVNQPKHGQRSTSSPWSTAPQSPALSEGMRTSSYDAFNSVDPFARGFAEAVSPSRNSHEQPRAGPSSTPMSSSNDSNTVAGSSDLALEIGDEEIVTTLKLPIPSYVTPTQGIEPLVVNHRLRYNILLANPDGHVSELRCSLPIHILDHALLDSTLAATRATRRILFGSEDAQGAQQEADVELPSYPAHVMDRVPNDENFIVGDAGGAAALEWVNSRLNAAAADGQSPRGLTTPPDSAPTSRHASRASSRAPSPDRDSNQSGEQLSRVQHGRNSRHGERERGYAIFSLRPFTKFTSGSSSSSRHHQQQQQQRHRDPSSSPSLPPTVPGDTPPNTILPLSRSRTSSFQSVQHAQFGCSTASSTTNSPSNPVTPLPADDPLCRVPHYDIASRGFLGGGVMPLTTMRGLPSYEEAASGRSGPPGALSSSERSLSEGDLSALFARAMRRS